MNTFERFVDGTQTQTEPPSITGEGHRTVGEYTVENARISCRQVDVFYGEK